MNRLYILFTVIVVMVGVHFARQEALAKVLTRLDGRGGDDEIEGDGGDDVDAGAGNDLIFARDTDGVDYIDCGGGFDVVETIHRDDRTKSNCERTLGPRQGDI
jgi:Ca2+-binding RTX toxin-like protein